jgi:hypothetical protein
MSVAQAVEGASDSETGVGWRLEAASGGETSILLDSREKDCKKRESLSAEARSVDRRAVTGEP